MPIWKKGGTSSGGVGPNPPLPLGECFDIRKYGGKADYGVVPPGTETDNGPAFVAAFAALHAAGGGYVCAPYDSRFPNGSYDVKTFVDIALPNPTRGDYGLIGSGSASPVTVDPAFGVGNIVFRVTGGDTAPFVVRNLVIQGTVDAGQPGGDCLTSFQSTDQTTIFQACVWNNLNCGLGVTYCFGSRMRFVDCSWNTCAAPDGFGYVTLDNFIWSRFENCFFQDGTLPLEAFIRARDPNESPNIGLSAQAVELLGCTFGEQARHSVFCKPATPGKRIPYVHVRQCSFEMSAASVVSAPQNPTSVRVENAEKVIIEQSDFLWAPKPLSIGIQLIDAGDVEIKQIHMDVGGLHVDPGHFAAGAGNNRIIADALTRSLRLEECDYIYLEADCPNIVIVKDGAETVISQSSGGTTLGSRVVAEDSLASTMAIPAAGGTGTMGILVEPATTVDLDAIVLSNADIEPAGSPGGARLTSGATLYETGVQATFSAAIAGDSNPKAHLDGRDTADVPYQDGGGNPPTAVWQTGTGASSDQAQLVVTNVAPANHDFAANVARVRAWSQWNPSMLIELFGEMLEGFYDDTSLHDDGSGKVDAWFDRSGKHNDLLQGNPANRPTYTAVGNNGLPQADFAGAQSLVAASMSLLRGSLGQGTIFFVGSYAGVAEAVAFAVTPTGALLPPGSITVGEHVTGIGGSESLAVTGLGDAVNSPVQAGFHTRAACFYDISRDLFIDNALYATEGLFVVIPNTLDQLTVGDVPPGGEALTGSIQAIVVLNQAAQYDQALLDKLQAWAKARYATP